MVDSHWYTIRLCKDGEEFKVLPNVLDTGDPRPGVVGNVIDGNDERRWKVRRVIRHSVSELVLDVDER